MRYLTMSAEIFLLLKMLSKISHTLGIAHGSNSILMLIITMMMVFATKAGKGAMNSLSWW